MCVGRGGSGGEVREALSTHASRQLLVVWGVCGAIRVEKIPPPRLVCV